MQRRLRGGARNRKTDREEKEGEREQEIERVGEEDRKVVAYAAASAQLILNRSSFLT